MQRLPVLLALGCALSGLCACTGTGVSAGDRLTPERELPPDYAAAWRSWYENDDAWPAWRPRVSADPELANFFVDNLLRVMVRHYERAALRRADQLPGPFERSRRELLHLGAYSAPVCTELVFTADSVVSFLAGDLVVELDEARWTLPFARRLESPAAEDRRRAAQWLANLPHAHGEEDAVWELLSRAALEDPEWFVRAQAVTAGGARALATGSLDRARPVLSRALADPDPAVVRAACEALALARDRRAVPALINLLERIDRGAGDLPTLAAARRALGNLAGDAVQRSTAAWRDWWRENRPPQGASSP
jgi:hypothetical protein